MTSNTESSTTYPGQKLLVLDSERSPAPLTADEQMLARALLREQFLRNPAYAQKMAHNAGALIDSWVSGQICNRSLLVPRSPKEEQIVKEWQAEIDARAT